jgi:NTP pyrophosphatase (non-canonical NTP hydrolase)
VNVVEAAASGDHLKLLLAMRERLSEAINDEKCHPRDLAALTRRLQEIAKEIEEITERQKREGWTGDDKNGKSGDDKPWDADI